MSESEDWNTLAGIQHLLETTPIHRLLAFRAVEVDPDAGTLSITCPTTGAAARADDLAQAHGGSIAALVDTTATFACCAALKRPVPTMNLHVDYLRPASGAEMLARATIRKLGKSATLVDVEVTSGGKLVAVGRCTLATAS